MAMVVIREVPQLDNSSILYIRKWYLSNAMDALVV
jgi:hypothetical protein